MLTPRLVFGLVLGAAALVPGCGSGAPQPSALRVRALPSPAPERSRLPGLSTDPSGQVLLSWVEERPGPEGSLATLLFSRLEPNGWSPPRTVASGRDWFVNWADCPSVRGGRDGMLAHFLQRTGAGTYDYCVQLAWSADGGAAWSAPQRLHEHAGGGEHGFVSLVPRLEGGWTAVWLDGRDTAPHEHGAEGGAMSLFARAFGPAGALGPEMLLDGRVCDCCPTAAARTGDGALLVAYRDRSEDEVRDISVLRLEDGRVAGAPWTSGDGWRIAGCPVNGPALAVRGERAAVVWYTFKPNGESPVLCALSGDGGRAWARPVVVADERVAGRVDAVFDGAGRLVVCWLETDGEDAWWSVARVDGAGGVMDAQRVVPTRGGRESGLGHLACDATGVVFACTDLDGEPRIGLRRLAWE